MFLLLSSIEGHAEHGGTLNEHQLSRLVSYFYILVMLWFSESFKCLAESHACS